MSKRRKPPISEPSGYSAHPCPARHRSNTACRVPPTPRYEVAAATVLYHRFLERIVARVSVTALLQRRYTVGDNVRECADEA